EACEKSLRSTDIFARYGGEEFVCVLLDSSPTGVLETAERIRQVLESAQVKTGQHRITATVSIGLAHLEKDTESTLDTLIQRADQALYQSKENGRNQTTIWREQHEHLPTSES
ncbi:MAG: GGDEF domain-containing protein, partial [Pseudomonadota bacterium]